MRLLLDENVPLRFVFDFGEHDAEHVRRLGWLAMPDRQIAERAADQFDAILTLDQTFPQELAGLDKYPAIIVLSPLSHRLVDVRELMPQILSALSTVEPGQVVRLYRPPAVLP